LTYAAALIKRDTSGTVHGEVWNINTKVTRDEIRFITGKALHNLTEF
jgi:hypothetical protein